MISPRRFALRLLWIAPALLLLWLVLRTVSLREVGALFANLRPAGLIALAAANVLVLLTFNARWWLLLRAQGHAVPYLALVGYRLAGFAVSYLTPGPHLGGEPLQVWLVSRRHGVPAAVSLSALVLDKTLEMFANFLFLLAGVVFVVRGRFLAAGVDWALLGWSVALALLPLLLLGALARGRQPVSGFALRVIAAWRRLRNGPTASQATPSRLVRALRQSEEQMGGLLRTQPGLLPAALALSLLTWAGILAEFWLMTRVLGLALSPADAVVALLAVRVAILLPLPAALGALEAGQILAMRMLGLPPAPGVGISLLIRARDILLAFLGLALAAAYSRTPAPLPAAPSEAS